jgi:hypothetical protein
MQLLSLRLLGLQSSEQLFFDSFPTAYIQSAVADDIAKNHKLAMELIGPSSVETAYTCISQSDLPVLSKVLA